MTLFNLYAFKNHFDSPEDCMCIEVYPITDIFNLIKFMSVNRSHLLKDYFFNVYLSIIL